MNVPPLRRAAPAFALAALTLLAAWPVLRAGYPTIGDGLNHYYRLAEFAHLLRQGVWFPRWAPDLAYGFGYPLFNYYPPLTYYLGALLHAVGLTFAHSLLGVYLLAWALAVTGAYAAAHDRWGDPAGLLAAAANGLSPYLYFNALARGALPETLGLGLLPWVLWAAGRLTPGKPLRLVTAALLFAALTLTHFLTAFLALPLLALAALWPAEPMPKGWGRLGRAGLAVALGLGLSAYFLLPAVLETGAVQVHQLTTPGDLDFRNNFLRLGALLAWPQPFDPRLVFHVVPPSLSLAALAVALIGLALTVWRTRRLDGATVAWAGALVVYTVLTLPATTALWTLVPVAGIIQFPWRLVGLASLVLALLAGRAVYDPAVNTAALANSKGEVRLRGLGEAQAIRSGRSLLVNLPGALLVIAVVVLYTFSLTWSFATAFDAPADAGVGDLTRYEVSSGQLGTTSAGEFLPVAVQTLPAADALSAAYAVADVISRLNTVPAGVRVTAQQTSVTSVGAQVTADAAATLTFDLFAYPGWRVAVDGQAVALRAAEGTGLITVEVPAGAHTVTVTFGLTPLRTAAVALSLLTALGLAAITVRGWRARPTLAGAASAPPQPVAVYIAVAVTALALLVLRVAAIEGRATVFARSPFDGAAVAGVARPLDVNFDDQLVLLGHDPAALTLPADGALDLTLYWRAQSVPSVDYAATVQVWDAAGNLWAQSDSQHPGRRPTTRWRTDQYARDAHTLTLPLGTPPGTYQVVVGVYPVSGPPLSVLDADQVPQGEYYALGPLTVTPAATLPTWTGTPLANVGVLRLLELTAEPRTLRPGDDVTLVLLWQTPGPAPDLTVGLGLLSADNQVIVEHSGPPSADYPVLDWRRGEIVRAVQHLRLPADAAPGRLTLAMRQNTVSTGAPIGLPVELPAYTFTVQALDRSYVVPPIQHLLPTDLGPAVQLLGYDLDVEAGSITLYWQTRALLDQRYTVFVQALGADGAVLAQADQQPANGARPTTSWLPGEVITDAYRLPLAGATQLSLGLYDPTTRVRLSTVTIALP